MTKRNLFNEINEGLEHLKKARLGKKARTKIGTATKNRAANTLEAMGLSISDAIRILMLRVEDEKRLPFEITVPNAVTKKAIAELEARKGKRLKSVKSLMADLQADD
jgi:DNA-damage-inducible protein J